MFGVASGDIVVGLSMATEPRRSRLSYGRPYGVLAYFVFEWSHTLPKSSWAWFLRTVVGALTQRMPERDAVAKGVAALKREAKALVCPLLLMSPSGRRRCPPPISYPPPGCLPQVVVGLRSLWDLYATQPPTPRAPPPSQPPAPASPGIDGLSLSRMIRPLDDFPRIPSMRRVPSPPSLPSAMP